MASPRPMAPRRHHVGCNLIGRCQDDPPESPLPRGFCRRESFPSPIRVAFGAGSGALAIRRTAACAQRAAPHFRSDQRSGRPPGRGSLADRGSAGARVTWHRDWTDVWHQRLRGTWTIRRRSEELPVGPRPGDEAPGGGRGRAATRTSGEPPTPRADRSPGNHGFWFSGRSYMGPTSMPPLFLGGVAPGAPAPASTDPLPPDAPRVSRDGPSVKPTARASASPSGRSAGSTWM